MNETIKQIEQMLGRNLSCIEAYTITTLLDQFPSDVIIEAMELSKDKKQPLLYFKRRLYNAMNPLEYKPKKEEEPVGSDTDSEWLKEFNKKL